MDDSLKKHIDMNTTEDKISETIFNKLNGGNLIFLKSGIEKILCNCKNQDSHILIFGNMGRWKDNFIKFITANKTVHDRIMNIISLNPIMTNNERLKKYKTIDLFAMHMIKSEDEFIRFVESHDKRKSFVKNVLGDVYDLYRIVELDEIIKSYDSRAIQEAVIIDEIVANPIIARQMGNEGTSSYIIVTQEELMEVQPPRIEVARDIFNGGDAKTTWHGIMDGWDGKDNPIAKIMTENGEWQKIDWSNADNFN